MSEVWIIIIRLDIRTRVMHPSFKVSKICSLSKVKKKSLDAFFNSIQQHKKLRENIHFYPCCYSEWLQINHTPLSIRFLLFSTLNSIELNWYEFIQPFESSSQSRGYIGILFLSRWSWLKMPKIRKIEKSKKVVLLNPPDLPHFAPLTPLKWFYISQFFAKKWL